MKIKSYLLLPLLTFFLTSLTFPVIAQAPLQIPYQGVARDAQGVGLQNQDISLILSIEDNTGAVLFSETHFTTTNQFGLFNVKIGNIIPLNIEWSNGTKFLHVEMGSKNVSKSMVLMELSLHSSVKSTMQSASKDSAVTTTPFWQMEETVASKFSSISSEISSAAAKEKALTLTSLSSK